MAASDGHKLYVVGGYGAPKRASVFSSGRWRRLPSLPEPRAAAGAAIVGRTLYVIGGVAEGGWRRCRSRSIYELVAGRGSRGRGRASTSA